MSAAPQLTRTRGLIELFLAAICFGCAAFVAKRATRSVDGTQVAFLRFAIGFGFVVLQALVRRTPLRPRRWSVLLMRGGFGGAAVLLYFLSLNSLPVGTATLLNCTSPAFTAIFAVIFLRERLPLARGAALLLAGAGIVLVLLGQGKALGGASAWQFAALGSGVLAGAAITSIRAARRTDGPWEIFGVFCLVGMAVTAPMAFSRWIPIPAEAWGYILGVGVLSVMGQVLMTHAYGVVEAATGVTISQFTVITSMSLGFFIDDDPFTWISTIGAVLTLSGIVWVARVNTRVVAPAEVRPAASEAGSK